jgi:type IV pilus assembly protein PilN
MIKINLLGVDSTVNVSGRIWLAGYLASLLLCALLFVWVSQSVRAEVQTRTAEADALQADFNMLKEKTKAVGELKQKKDTLNNKLAIIAKLKKSKMGPVHVMDDLNKALVPGVWLREVLEKDGVMQIKARALGDQDIVLFLGGLKRSSYFELVELKESQQVYYSKRTGQVSREPDITGLREGSLTEVGRDVRVTKESGLKAGARGQAGADHTMRGARILSGGKSAAEGVGGRGQRWSVVGGEGAGAAAVRTKNVDEFNIKIKEFIVDAKVNYAGKLKQAESEAGAGAQPAAEEQRR